MPMLSIFIVSTINLAVSYLMPRELAHNVPCFLMQIETVMMFFTEFSAIFTSACREEGADQEVIDLLPGNQYILPYRPISSLVHSGAAKLI